MFTQLPGRARSSFHFLRSTLPSCGREQKFDANASRYLRRFREWASFFTDAMRSGAQNVTKAEIEGENSSGPWDRH